MNRTRSLRRIALTAGVATVAVVLAGCGMLPGTPPSTTPFSGLMSAASEVPPNASRATGMAEAWFDKTNNTLRYRITYAGLTGPATMAHFHGPAIAGANAGVVVPFLNPDSPIEGTATLTPAQAADLMAGKWYANVHTAANPAGEIRGQLLPKM